jgi:hypothetical protein
MKKAYVLLLIASHVVSLSSMEMQKHKQQLFPKSPYSDTTEIPLATLNPRTAIATHIQKSAPIAIVANEPGWKKCNEIMNMTYKRNQPIVIHNPFTPDLTPIYKQPTKSIKHQEKKPLLRTNISPQPDNNVMQELYDKVYSFIWDECRNKRLNQLTQNKELVRIIEHMNNARSSNINEDVIGRFAYNKEGFICSVASKYVPLFFTLLKRYTSTTNVTKEPLPFNAATQELTLEQVIGISNHTNNKTDILDVYSYLEQSPAFFHLHFALRYLLQCFAIEGVDNFTTYLYGDEKILLEDYEDGSYIDLKNEFYDKAYNVLLHNNNAQDIYHLIQIIDKAKTSKNIHQESNLANAILNFDFEPTKTITAQVMRLFEESHSTINIKNRISVFCSLVAKYNDLRLTKITPTPRQYKAYLLKKQLDIPLPDSVYKAHLLDDNSYAFTAFKQLIENTNILIKSDDKNVQKCVAQLYPQKK